jgi:hypothetical protein
MTASRNFVYNMIYLRSEERKSKTKGRNRRRSRYRKFGPSNACIAGPRLQSPGDRLVLPFRFAAVGAAGPANWTRVAGILEGNWFASADEAGARGSSGAQRLCHSLGLKQVVISPHPGCEWTRTYERREMTRDLKAEPRRKDSRNHETPFNPHLIEDLGTRSSQLELINNTLSTDVSYVRNSSMLSTAQFQTSQSLDEAFRNLLWAIFGQNGVRF